MKAVTILGSTGSIGRQMLEVLEKEKQFFVYGLSCEKNETLMRKQIRLFHPKVVVVKEPNVAKKLQKTFQNLKILQGEQGLKNLTKDIQSKIVVIAISGQDAIHPLLSAISANKKIIMANKEAIICHPEKIKKALKDSDAKIIPVDSEVFAISKCLPPLKKEKKSLGICRFDISKVTKMVITCSGGPFLGKKRNELKAVSVFNACSHPTWNMGKIISINSATLANKGLEVLETHYLFGIPLNAIEVKIHKECLVHAEVHFQDGTKKMVIFEPDMKIPLRAALLDEKKSKSWKILTFSQVDHDTFPAILSAYKAGKMGTKYAKKYCIKNEEGVKKFIDTEISFRELLDFMKQFF